MEEKELENLGEVKEETNQEGQPENETLNKDNSQDNHESKEELTKERRKQQLEGSKQEAERLRALAIDTAVNSIKLDANVLLDLHKKDPRLATEVATKMGYTNSNGNFVEFKNYKEAEDYINSKILGKEKSNDEVKEEDFEKYYQKKRTKERHEESLLKAEKLIKKIKDEDLQEKAQTYFNKISKGHQLDEETATEFAEMATLYVTKDKVKSERLNDGLAELGSTGVGNSKKNSSSESQRIVRNGELVLDSNNKK